MEVLRSAIKISGIIRFCGHSNSASPRACTVCCACQTGPRMSPGLVILGSAMRDQIAVHSFQRAQKFDKRFIIHAAYSS
jgi:hypothetical protein